MRRPAIQGVELLIAIAVGVGGGVYTVQPALEAMKQRHEAVKAAREAASSADAVVKLVTAEEHTAKQDTSS